MGVRRAWTSNLGLALDNRMIMTYLYWVMKKFLASLLYLESLERRATGGV